MFFVLKKSTTKLHHWISERRFSSSKRSFWRHNVRKNNNKIKRAKQLRSWVTSIGIQIEAILYLPLVCVAVRVSIVELGCSFVSVASVAILDGHCASLNRKQPQGHETVIEVWIIWYNVTSNHLIVPCLSFLPQLGCRIPPKIKAGFHKYFFWCWLGYCLLGQMLFSGVGVFSPLEPSGWSLNHLACLILPLTWTFVPRHTKFTVLELQSDNNAVPNNKKGSSGWWGSNSIKFPVKYLLETLNGWI